MRIRAVILATSLTASGLAIAQPTPADPAPPPATPETPPPDATPPPTLPTPPTPPTPPLAGKPIAIVGKVIDAYGKPLRGAKVHIEGLTTKKTTTDKFGAYRLDDVPTGATILVDRDGYQTGIGTATGNAVDDIVLLAEDQYSETIELKGEAPATSPGAEKLDRSELQRIPGTGGDIVKTLTAMPGVVNLQIPLGYSGVVIRGSSPQDSKVLVDDFEIPVLFHNIGFRAVLPAEAINSLDYIPGGFDVAYGRASSGIVALTTRAGSDKRTEQAEVSVIDGGVLAQGSTGKDTHYMFGIRRSVIDFVLPKIIPASLDLSLTTVPSYWDGQFRIDHKLDDKWKLTLSGLGSIDTFQLYATKDAEAQGAQTKRFFNRTRFLRVTAAAKYHDGPWSAHLALSGILPEFIFELGQFQYIRTRQPAITPRVEITRTAPELAGLKDIVWRVGAELTLARSHVSIALPQEPREGEPQMQAMDPKDTTTTFSGTIWTPDAAVWTALTGSFDPKIRGTLGMRLDYYGRPNQLLVEPRGELQWKLTKPWSLRFSGGAFSRPPEFQSEFLQKSIQAEQSRQAITGVQYEPREGTRVQASVYYTDRTNLIVHDAVGNLENDGHGTTTGAELLATYRSGGWFGWLSYSYSHSTRIDHPGETRRLFSYDQPHSLNAALSWKSKTGKWQLGGRFQVYSGLPYTAPTGSIYDNTRNVYIPIYGEPNSSRAPLHHQLDVRVDRMWHWGPVEMTAFLDVQNVYMNESIVTYFYSYDFTQQAAFKSIPIIPSIGLRGVL